MRGTLHADMIICNYVMSGRTSLQITRLRFTVIGDPLWSLIYPSVQEQLELGHVLVDMQSIQKGLASRK